MRAWAASPYRAVGIYFGDDNRACAQPNLTAAVDEDARRFVSGGWSTMNAIIRIGDLDRDGYPDLLAARTSDGNLFLYPGRVGMAVGTRILVGPGWNTMSELAGVGDLHRDDYPDPSPGGRPTGGSTSTTGPPAGSRPACTPAPAGPPYAT